jgi:hypothetical protein
MPQRVRPRLPQTRQRLPDEKTFTIDQTFTRPLTVCYLAQRLTLKNVGAGAGGSAPLVEEYWHPNSEK